MSALINPALDIAQAVGDLAGVPYLSTAITLVKCIKDNCEKVPVRKDECRQLADKAAQLTETFQEQASLLQESQLREHADMIEAALAKVNSRTNRWASYSYIHAFLRDSKIGDGIRQCTMDIDTALSSFHVNAAIISNYNLEQLKRISLYSADNVEKILGILYNPDEVRKVAALQKSGEPVAERIMNAGKQRLQVLREQHGDPSVPVQSDAYQQTQRGMAQLYAMTGVPPTVRILNGEVTRPDELPYVGGVFSDIWIGYWLGDQKVALKTMRGVVITPEKARKRFEKEIEVWSKLTHQHVLPFLGIVTDLGHFTHMVSPWQENGNILDYIRKYERADRYHLLWGAADGLAYLHSQKVAHGNVRCANILVAIGGEAVICDFGMSKVREDTTAQSATMTLTSQGSARWMSPELLDATVTSPTPQCDVYSFAMTMLECFTLEIPFIEIKREIHVITKMSKGPLTPKRPLPETEHRWITDEVWDLMLECWKRDPAVRPETRVLADRVSRIEIDARRAAFPTTMSPSPSPSPTPPPQFTMPTPKPFRSSSSASRLTVPSPGSPGAPSSA